MWRPRSGWESELGPWVKHCAAPDVRVPILVRQRAAIDQFDEPHPALHEPPRHQALPSEALRAAAFQTVQLERRLGLGRQIEGLRSRSRGSWREARRLGPGRASGRASPGTGRAGPAPAGRSARTGAVRRRARRSPLHGPSPRPAASGGSTPGPQLPDPGSRRASSAVCRRALDPPGRTRTAARPAAGPAASWPASGADAAPRCLSPSGCARSLPARPRREIQVAAILQAQHQPPAPHPLQTPFPMRRQDVRGRHR